MNTAQNVIIIGAGPSGLIAAERLAEHNISVTLYDRMKTPARKFLMAGHGGLNLTNSEPLDEFIKRYGDKAELLAPTLRAFTPDQLRDWAEELGIDSFIGTSGRVFPKEMKATPLLRRWLSRLDHLGVRFMPRHEWKGFNENGDHLFDNEKGENIIVNASAALLAMGGASWPHLGSNGSWVDLLKKENLPITPLEPANCGFTVPWTEHFATRHAGQPLKPIIVHYKERKIQGELMITKKGLEGGPLYALSNKLRTSIKDIGTATIFLDLRPGLSVEELDQRLSRPRGSESLSTFLQKAGGLSPQAIGLLREVEREQNMQLPQEAMALAAFIKRLPLIFKEVAPIKRAISTAGGLSFDALDEHFMIKNKPGIFAAGEMLDWEAPTGGYLLQACFSTGAYAANQILSWLYSA